MAGCLLLLLHFTSKNSDSCIFIILETSLELVDEITADNPDATGAELLWQPEMSRLYVALLKETLSEEIVEGILGALQNLTRGEWKV